MLRKTHAVSILFSIAVFLLSLVVSPYYIYGDQLHYKNFYNSMPEFGFFEGFKYYNSSLSSREWFYYSLIYTFAGWLDKNVLMSFLNAALAFFVAVEFLRRGASKFLLCMIFFNFYFLILLFSAERLKLGVLFCLLAFSTQGCKGFICWVMALLSHAQTLILLVISILSKMAADAVFIFQGRLKYGFLISVALFVVFVVIIVTALGDHIATKFDAYSGPDGIFAGGWQALWKPTIFLVGSAFYAKQKRYEAVIANIPLLVAAFFVGDERLVMFSYFIFMYYAVQVNNGLNVGVLMSSFYLLVKGVLFLSNILAYGDGFYGG